MQSGDKESFLELYREALRLRCTLVADEALEWVGSREQTRRGLLHFARAGWLAHRQQPVGRARPAAAGRSFSPPAR